MAELGEVVQATHNATLNYAAAVWTRFDTAAEPVIVAVATLTLVVMGYLLFTGQLSLTAGQLFPRLLRWVVLLVVLLNMPDIFPWAFSLVTDVPAAVAVFLLAGGPVTDEAGVIGLIETVMNAGIEAASTIWTEATFYDITLHILSGLLLLTGLVLAVLAAVLLMVSKLGVGILLAVAPFFLLLRLLDLGKGLFEGWLRQLLTFALIPIFVYSLIALNFGILTTGPYGAERRRRHGGRGDVYRGDSLPPRGPRQYDPPDASDGLGRGGRGRDCAGCLGGGCYGRRLHRRQARHGNRPGHTKGRGGGGSTPGSGGRSRPKRYEGLRPRWPIKPSMKGIYELSGLSQE